MALHTGYKVFRIENAHNPMNPGETVLIDLHAIPANEIPDAFRDYGTAEQWLKHNGGMGIDYRHTIIELMYWDYE